MNREFLTVGGYIPIQEVSPRLVEDQAVVLAKFSDFFQGQQNIPEGLSLLDSLHNLYHPGAHPLLAVFDSFYMVVASIVKGSLGPVRPTTEAEVVQKEILVGLTEVMRMMNSLRGDGLFWPEPRYHQSSSGVDIWNSSKIMGDSRWTVSYTPAKRRLSFNWFQNSFDQPVDNPAPYYLTASFSNRIYYLDGQGIIHNGFGVERWGWKVGPGGYLKPSAGRNLFDDYMNHRHLMKIASGSIEDCFVLQQALMGWLNIGIFEPTMPPPRASFTLSGI